MDGKLQSISHKGEKVHSYSVEFKLEVIRYAASRSNHAAAKKYKVDWNSIRKWREKQGKLEELKQEKSGGGKR